MTSFLTGCVAFLYLGSSVCVWRYLSRLQSSLLKGARILMALGMLIHIGLFILNFQSPSETGQSRLFLNDLGFTGVGSVLIFLLLWARRSLPVVGFALPGIAATMFLFLILHSEARVATLPSVWLWTHIGLMILGELVFFFSAAAGLSYLLADWQLTHNKSLRFLASLPSLPQLDQILGRLLVVGLSLMTLGLILGIFFAQQFWEGEWWLNPTVIFAFLTWLVYFLLVLVRQLLPKLRGRISAWAAFGGFFLVLFASLAIDHMGQSPHYDIAPKTEGHP